MTDFTTTERDGMRCTDRISHAQHATRIVKSAVDHAPRLVVANWAAMRAADAGLSAVARSKGREVCGRSQLPLTRSGLCQRAALGRLLHQRIYQLIIAGHDCGNDWMDAAGATIA